MKTYDERLERLERKDPRLTLLFAAAVSGFLRTPPPACRPKQERERPSVMPPWPTS